MIVIVVDSILSGRRLLGPGWQFLYYEFIGALVANGVLIAGELFMPEENVERVRGRGGAWGRGCAAYRRDQGRAQRDDTEAYEHPRRGRPDLRMA